MKILVTGTAGFIGFHVAQKLLHRGDEVVGIDNINSYYDTRLKYGRLAETGISHKAAHWHRPVVSNIYPGYTFIRMNVEDRERFNRLFEQEKFDRVVHLAAQAGVRYSLENPHAYISSNIVGFINILEACRHYKLQHLVYASSSSVYGSNKKMPLSTSDNVDHPISLYAATKKSNELMAHTYSHLFNLPTTGLRFFTVYGPWGRPDMALFLFAKAIIEGKPIKVFNNGNMVRDFTYVDDIVEGVVRVLDNPPGHGAESTEFRAQGTGYRARDNQQRATSNEQQVTHNQYPATNNQRQITSKEQQATSTQLKQSGNPASAGQSASSPESPPYKIYNLGNASPTRLLDYISAIENHLGKKAIKEFLPMQLGDVPYTEADVTDLVRDMGYKPATAVEEGIGRFLEWYEGYYGIGKQPEQIVKQPVLLNH